ncbi:hypothetical protein Tco_0544152 [Tanacetum coccineum]
MSTLRFAETHNLVAFLEKPTEGKRFEQIVDFLNANPIKYALTVNPTIYTSCIEQFWTSAKVKTIKEEVRIQALVDGKKVIVDEASIRSDLRLDDVEGTACLNNDTIFEELARMGMLKNLDGCVKFLMYPRFVQVFINQQLRDVTHHKKIFVNPSHIKKIFANMKREGKGFSGAITPLFDTMMVQATEDLGAGSELPTDTYPTPIITQPSSSKPKKKHKSRRIQRKEINVPQDESPNEESVPTPSNDPLPSGEDRMQLTELMVLCTKLQKQVLDLEEAKTAQAKEIVRLKKKVKKLERKQRSRTSGLKRLKKVGAASRVESSEDKDSLGRQEDASKQGMMIDNIDQDEEINLVNEDLGRMNDQDMFGVNDLDGDGVVVNDTADKSEEHSVKVAEKEVSIVDLVTTADEVVTTANVEVTTVSTPITTIDEMTLAQTLIEIKVAKPKAITTTATTVTAAVTRPKAKGVVIQEPSGTPSPKPIVFSQNPSQSKDKGKEKMVEPERPLKKKEQIMMDKQMARDLAAQLQAEMEEEDRAARLKE